MDQDPSAPISVGFKTDCLTWGLALAEFLNVSKNGNAVTSLDVKEKNKYALRMVKH